MFQIRTYYNITPNHFATVFLTLFLVEVRILVVYFLSTKICQLEFHDFFSFSFWLELIVRQMMINWFELVDSKITNNVNV